MKAILEFNLPDENSEYKMAHHASGIFCAAWDFDQWLRSECKYYDKQYDDIRKKFRDCLEDQGIMLEEIM